MNLWAALTSEFVSQSVAFFSAVKILNQFDLFYFWTVITLMNLVVLPIIGNLIQVLGPFNLNGSRTVFLRSGPMQSEFQRFTKYELGLWQLYLYICEGMLREVIFLKVRKKHHGDRECGITFIDVKPFILYRL